MSQEIISRKAGFKALPEQWPESLLPRISSRVAKAGTKIVVLDDDPTGTQTVHGLPVLTTWDTESLVREFETPGNAFFILTNSRALTRAEACSLAREIGNNLAFASQKTGMTYSVISRSDSTLRGHFPHEVDEMAKTMGQEQLPYLICPFFLEGGRFTMDDVHYVAEGEDLIPAAQTPFAKDAVFGYTESNLCRWVEEKTQGRIPADQVVSVTLDHIRKGGPKAVADVLEKVPDKGACIVNAVSYADMEVVISGLLDCLDKGQEFLYRTAASFVRVRAGIHPMAEYLSKKDLITDTPVGGLFVVGSYVPKTTAQVRDLMANTDILPIEIEVEKILDPQNRASEIEIMKTRANYALKEGQDTLVYTSRRLITVNDPEKNLEIGEVVSSSLIELIKKLECTPRYLVAKGGITSSDVAVKGLGLKRGLVMGQAMPGVPVWKLGPESRMPGMSYIIFPGNVGDDRALTSIQQKLIRKDHAD